MPWAVIPVLRAAGIFGLEAGEGMMISVNSFDVMGAKAWGFRGAFVNRYQFPMRIRPPSPMWW